MKEYLNSDKWVNSLDYKIWSIAYEIADPEDQIECIKHLLREEIKLAYSEGIGFTYRESALDIVDYLASKEL